MLKVKLCAMHIGMSTSNFPYNYTVVMIITCIILYMHANASVAHCHCKCYIYECHHELALQSVNFSMLPDYPNY